MTLISIAGRLFSTAAAMIAPCSVNTSGVFRRPPRPSFEVTNCDFKRDHSAVVNLNAKSRGKRRALRFTAGLRCLVETP